MANVTTDQKAPLAPPEGGNSPAASIALNEENLEALLKAVTAPAEAASAIAPPVPMAAPVAASFEPLPPTDSVPVVRPAEWAESAAAPVSGPSVESTLRESLTAQLPDAPEQATEPQAAEIHQAAETHRETESHPESPVREVAAAGESHQEVVSKLALLSSIKQRRAVAMRPEPANTVSAEPEIVPSGNVPIAAALKDVTTSKPMDRSVENRQPVVEDRRVPLEKQPVRVAPKEPIQQKVREPQKRPLPVEGMQRNSAEIARGEVPGPASKSLSSPTGAGAALFTLGNDYKDPSGNPQSFVASSAGRVAIGGAIVAIGLTAYLLMGHGTKRAASPPKPPAAVSVQAPVVSTPEPVSPSAGKSSPEKLTAEKPVAVPTPSGASRPEVQKRDERPPAKVEAVQQVKTPNLPPPASPAPPPAPAEISTARTASRPFAPPTVGTRPADSTVVEAPPALSSGTPTLPTVAALPARVAPPPPPASAPKAPGPPRQVTVADRVQATRLMSRVTPAYPALAKATRVQGIVHFRATIGTDGQIKGLTVLSGPPPLIQGATDAVKQWRYQPTIVNGETVEVITEIEVAFTL